MNKEVSGAYEAPQVEIVEVAVEYGFALSPYSGDNPPEIENGGAY